MHRDGRVRVMNLEPGTLFVLSGAARHKWKHELPAPSTQRAALIIRAVKPKHIVDGQSPFGY